MVIQVKAHVSIVAIMRARSWFARTAVDMGSSPIREQFYGTDCERCFESRMIPFWESHGWSTLFRAGMSHLGIRLVLVND